MSKCKEFSMYSKCLCCAPHHHQALEKNQQWMTYDQQREAFVQSVLARTHELEQQLAQAKQQQPAKQEAATSDGEKYSSFTAVC